MSWRKARSIEQFFEEANQASPSRNTISDGTIGNTAHQAGWESSDHNPWVTDSDGQGVVRALDITVDPANGIVGDVLAERIRDLGKSGHPALGPGAYVIWEGRIASATQDGEPWDWEPYGGSNPHNHHVHVSVSRGTGYDSTARWGIFDQEDDMADPATQAQLDRIEKQVTRLREGSFKRDKRVLEALDALVNETGKTARKTQVAAIKALLRDQDGDA